MNGITVAEISLKKCSKCGEVKEASLKFFWSDNTHKDGLASACKVCRSLNAQKYYIDNQIKMRERVNKWQSNNTSNVREHQKKWYKTHSIEQKKASKEWYEAHPIEAKEARKKWCKENPDKRKAIQKRSDTKIRSTEKGKLSGRIRVRIRESLRRIKAGRHWETLVGFTVEQLKTHIEKQFKDGMSWELFMQGKIHIDHKIPKSVFNYNSPDDIDFKHCWALSNLQPMWAFDNRVKYNKLEAPFQPSLCINA
jgi:hypothetical protein